jgi:hypothetical protein
VIEIVLYCEQCLTRFGSARREPGRRVRRGLMATAAKRGWRGEVCPACQAADQRAEVMRRLARELREGRR